MDKKELDFGIALVNLMKKYDTQRAIFIGMDNQSELRIYPIAPVNTKDEITMQLIAADIMANVLPKYIQLEGGKFTYSGKTVVPPTTDTQN